MSLFEDDEDAAAGAWTATGELGDVVLFTDVAFSLGNVDDKVAASSSLIFLVAGSSDEIVDV
jgi:hypothetical protein